MPKHNPASTVPDHLDEDDRQSDLLHGTAAICIIDRYGGAEMFFGDYEIDTMLESSPEQLRAYRKRRKREGKPVPKLSENSLRDNVLIAFGPQVSPQRAIAALEQAIESITKNGLLTGRDSDGNPMGEGANE